jgi:hypothetical protein
MMNAGPLIFSFGLLCLFLVGPFGPCGPSSPLGLLLLLGGFLAGVGGWCVSAIALAAAAKRDRSELVRAGFVAAGLAFAGAMAVAYTMPEGPESWFAARRVVIWAWPPLAAACVAIGRWYRERGRRTA